MNLNWIKCQGNQWCSLLNVNLSHDHFKNLEGIYIIWHSGEQPWTVYVGQGIISERLAEHRRDDRILGFSYHGLFVTWTQLDDSFRNGVERFLIESLEPRIRTICPTASPVPVNLPW